MCHESIPNEKPEASFAQPDADIGAVVPVIAACFTPGPLLLGAAVHLLLKRLKKRSATLEEIKEATGGAREAEEVPSSMSLLQQPNGESSKGT
ncbi:hypothetical protein COOONC_20469 [Cooperia oncophora]